MKATKVERETYQAYVSCQNCGGPEVFWRGSHIDIPKGQAVDETPCPKCGVKALRRR